MKIRAYAKAAGFEVVGKLTYMGKWNRNARWYMDEARNAYLIDTNIGGISIIPRVLKKH